MQLSFSQTTCSLSSATIFQSNYLFTIKCNYLSVKLLVHYQVQLSISHSTRHYQVQLSFSQTTCSLLSATIFQSNYLFTIKCNYLSVIVLVHYQVQLSFSHTTCPLSSATIFQSYYLSTIKCSYLSVILLVHYQVQLSINQTACPLSSATIFQSYYLSTIKCNYLSVILLVHYLSVKLLVHYQVQLSYSHTSCPLSFSHTSCPLSSAIMFQLYYLSTFKRNYLSFSYILCNNLSVLIVHYQVQLFPSYYLSTSTIFQSY